jgi:drug/metabolite transporter (DMT)-like permease
VIAIVGGLGAALSWAIATLSSSRSSRMIGPFSVISWVMTVGLVVSIGPAAFAVARPLDIPQIAGLIAVGVTNNVGLLLAYAALTIGRVSIVAPIIATEGAAAALISIALGESINVPTAIVLTVIAVGVVLAAIERSTAPDREPNALRTAILAVAASASFSIGLVVAGRLGASLPAAWVVVATRIVGVTAIALPMLLLGRLRLVRPAVPFVFVAGVLEALGSWLYVIAAHDGVAAAAVLGSQFAAIAAVGAYYVFGERLQRIQLAGVAMIAIGVTALAVVRA